MLHEQLSLYGPASLSILDLWSLVLMSSPTTRFSSQVQRLARLVEREGWRELTQASLPELQRAGFSQRQAERIVVVCELTRRLALLENEPLPQIKRGEDAVRLLWPLMIHLKQEVMRVLVLNAHNQVVENTELYRGSALSACIRIAEVLRPAVVRNCPSILVAHFHPSGNPEPSAADLETTEDLRQAARLLNIELLDHLILGSTRAVSLREVMNW